MDNQYPLVSAVMITGKDAKRYKLAQAAVRSFQAQTWPNKELVIIDDSPAHWPDHENLHIVRPQPGLSLGELRNLALDNKVCRGDWIVQWDDDDWSHPTRIAAMMDIRQPDHAITLRYQTRFSFENSTAFALKYDQPDGIPGTVLHAKTNVRYRTLDRHEDTHFLRDAFGPKTIVMDNHPESSPGPSLYLRFFHGNNTWSERHIMRAYADREKAGRWELPKDHADYLRSVLQTQYDYHS